jgi:Family of unknown function (DUF5677)
MDQQPQPSIEQMRDGIGEALHSRLRELNYFNQKVIATIVQHAHQTTPIEEAIRGSFARIGLWLDSLARMSGPQDFQTVAAGARCMFELLLDIKQLHENPALANAFFDFSKVKRFDIADNLLKFLDSHPSIPRDHGKAQQNWARDPKNRDEREALCKKHGWVNKSGDAMRRVDHWWGNSVGERAKSFGEEYEHIYWNHYSVLSQYVHAGGAGIIDLPPAAFSALFGVMLHLVQRSCEEAFEIVARTFVQSAALKTVLDGLKEVCDADLLVKVNPSPER